MKMIQIRNVPDDVHRTLKARAAQAGMTLSDFLLKEVAFLARRPTFDEIGERVKQLHLPRMRIDSAAEVRAEREARK